MNTYRIHLCTQLESIEIASQKHCLCSGLFTLSGMLSSYSTLYFIAWTNQEQCNPTEKTSGSGLPAWLYLVFALWLLTLNLRRDSIHTHGLAYWHSWSESFAISFSISFCHSYSRAISTTYSFLPSKLVSFGLQYSSALDRRSLSKRYSITCTINTCLLYTSDAADE